MTERPTSENPEAGGPWPDPYAGNGAELVFVIQNLPTGHMDNGKLLLEKRATTHPTSPVRKRRRGGFTNYR